MIAVDLVFTGGKQVRLQDALRWTVLWIALALCFAGVIYLHWGRGPAVIWLTAFLLEKSLSVDNLFVFMTIFASFRTPLHFQHRVCCLCIVLHCIVLYCIVLYCII